MTKQEKFECDEFLESQAERNINRIIETYDSIRRRPLFKSKSPVSPKSLHRFLYEVMHSKRFNRKQRKYIIKHALRCFTRYNDMWVYKAKVHKIIERFYGGTIDQRIYHGFPPERYITSSPCSPLQSAQDEQVARTRHHNMARERRRQEAHPPLMSQPPFRGPEVAAIRRGGMPATEYLVGADYNNITHTPLAPSNIFYDATNINSEGLID